MNAITIKDRTLSPKLKITPFLATTRTTNLRKYQGDILRDHLLQNRFTLTESPTGSGKTTIMLCLAEKRFKQRKKVIIITPKLGINSGFVKYTRGQRFKVDDCLLPDGSVREASGRRQQQKSQSVIDFLAGDNRWVMVCSYQSFRRALSHPELLKNLVLMVDEIHHSSMDESGDNRLGEIVSKAVNLCQEVHVFTATAFRADGSSLVNGEFVHHRRTLREHYLEKFCPDFGVYVRFYQNLRKKKFDSYAENRRIGSSKALIAAYLDEYDKHPLPTLMLVDSARQAKDLNTALRRKFKDLRGKNRLVNLGSEDGSTLESTRSRVIRRKYRLLDPPKDTPNDERVQVVIAIGVMDEGVDWPDCAQTFSPRVSGSLVLLMQRAIGRSMRLKYKDHPSRGHSRVVLFEIGIAEEDQSLVAGSLFELAVRLKALCDGVDFVEPFRLKLPRKKREKVDKEKADLRDWSNPQMNFEISQELIEAASRGVKSPGLIQLCMELYEERGREISHICALELLIAQGIGEVGADLEAEISQQMAKRLRGKLAGLSFVELLEDEKFRELLERVAVRGVSEYASILGVKGDLEEVSRILREHLQSSVDKNKEELLRLARSGADRPYWKTKLGSALGSYTCRSQAHDPEFDGEIRRLRPDWFVNTADLNKEELLKLARSGADRPKRRTKLGSALNCYASQGHGYDPEFAGEVRCLRPDWFNVNVDLSKEELLRLAKSGADRPNSKTKLGSALVRYTCQSSGSSEFDGEIRRLRPDWFVNTVDLNKEELLKLARNGADRPKKGRTKLGSALVRYTCRSQAYDPEFGKKIRRLRPDWFINTADLNKSELLKLARSGADRPNNKKTKLGSALSCYMSQGRDSYDPEFDKKIRRLRPDWFNSTADLNKEELLKLARSGADRPKSRTKLGRALGDHACQNNRYYDPEFGKKIRRLRPDWFVNTVDLNKEELLRLARSGADRPNWKTKLGSALHTYTCRSQAYDPEFDGEIRRLRPDWFNVNTADLNKEELLKLARNGADRPNNKKTKLGKALVNYTCQSSGSYDPEFGKKIRRLRPDWFRR